METSKIIFQKIKIFKGNDGKNYMTSQDLHKVFNEEAILRKREHPQQSLEDQRQEQVVDHSG